MATSDGLDGCLQRGRSQSDPNLLIEPGIDLTHGTGKIDQRVLRTGCLVTGVHTPPIRRNSKLATLGRIFKPWKWRKKKNEKLKQSSTGTVSLLCDLHDPSSPTRGCCSDGAVLLGGFRGSLNSNLTISSVEYLGPEEELPPPGSTTPHYVNVFPKLQLSIIKMNSIPHEPADKYKDKIMGKGRVCYLQFICSLSDSGPVSLPTHLPNSYLPKEPPPRATESMASMTLPLRGLLANTSGSPYIGNMMHPPMPPSCIMEELQRAFASKNRQESRPHPQGCGKEAEENKENMRLDQCFSNTSGLPTDLEEWNDSVISGTLPRRLRKELLSVKLRNRPSKQELEDRNIFPVRSDQERQEIRQQIEMKLAKRLSQRPNVEELESRNILKQRNDQTEQEERREIKQRLNRKLNQRPTVDELRDRKILIRFSDYVEVAKAQDYDRRADKPWTRLSAADKAAIRKELNEFKSTEMEVHASSKHLTRFHRP
uniref:Phosphatase and actin regulator n=1 Tax=Cyclopterus lumpus TaxID=8103 RepID=A0A8C2X932_CYCLU